MLFRSIPPMTGPGLTLVPPPASGYGALPGILEAAASALVAVDAEGLVLVANARARALLARCPALLRGRRLLARRAADRAELGPVLERLAGPEPFSACVVLPTRAGGPVLMLQVSRLEGCAPALGLVTLLEMGGAEGDAAALAQKFGLTQAQARAAALLAQGLAVPQIAERLAVAVSTVRTQVGLVRERLGMESQQALAVVLARALVLLRDGGG